MKDKEIVLAEIFLSEWVGLGFCDLTTDNLSEEEVLRLLADYKAYNERV